MGRDFAGILGLVAFCTTVLRGAIAGVAEDALLTATIHLFAFAAAGWVLGTIAESTIEQSVRTRFAAELKAAEDAAKTEVKT
jgi:hypothetical protein